MVPSNIVFDFHADGITILTETPDGLSVSFNVSGFVPVMSLAEVLGLIGCLSNVFGMLSDA